MLDLLHRIRTTACVSLLACVALGALAPSAWAAVKIGTIPNQASTAGQAIVALVVNGEEMTTIKGENTLPEGLHINKVSASKFRIEGTPGKVETATVKLVAENAGGTETSPPVEFTWTVEAAPTIEKPADQTTLVGQAITPLTIKGSNLATLEATEGLPAGLELKRVSPTEGTIAGTPTVPGPAATVKLEGTNPAGGKATQTFLWRVIESAPTLARPADQSTPAGKAVAVTLTGANLSVIEPEELPAGLELKKVTESEWLIVGTPTTVKAATVVTLKAKNKESTPLAAPVTFSWTVSAAEVPAKKEAETPSKPPETPVKPPETPKATSAGRLGTVPIQKQGRELFASFLCEVASCKVTITGAITAYKTKFKIHSVATAIAQGKKVRIALKLTKKQQTTVSAALKKHKKVTASLTASINSSVGMQVTKALLVTVKR
jgi:Putative Ig domain